MKQSHFSVSPFYDDCLQSFGQHAHNGHICLNVQVVPGDFLVLGSDGLFDNVSDDVILAEVQTQLAAKKRASFIAQRLCAIAFNNSVDKDALTPYSVAATEAFDMVYSGGKKDDITVIAAQIQ